MKQYEITITVRTPSKLKDVVWAIERMLPFNVSVKSKEVVDRPTTVEHHGGVESDLKRNGVDLDRFDNYSKIPERY